MAWYDPALKRLAEALPRRIQESIWNNLFSGDDPDANLTAEQGGSWYYKRLSQSDRDLNPLLQDRMLAIASWLYDSNPLAKCVIEITRDYVLGEGVRYEVGGMPGSGQTDPDSRQVQAIKDVLDAFWEDPINNCALNLHQWILELGMFGEAVWSATINPRDGSVRLSSLDPGQVQGVVVQRGRPQQATDLLLRQMAGLPGGRLKVIRQDVDPQSPTFGRRIGAHVGPDGEPDEKYDTDDSGNGALYQGSAFFWAINKTSSARRGRSDLLCLADWIDGYDQVLFNEVDRSLLMRAFVWDVSIKGATRSQIDEFLKANPAPKPGAIRAHDDRVMWQAVSPKLEQTDVKEGADLLLSYIAAGGRVAKTWLNGSLDVNKSMAEALTEPAFKRLALRQLFVKQMITDVLHFVLDQAELAGILPMRPARKNGLAPLPWPVTVNMPELVSRNIFIAGRGLAYTAGALEQLRLGGTIDMDTEQQVIAMLIGQMGIEIDLEAMQGRIEQEKADAAAQAADAHAKQLELAKAQQASTVPPGPGEPGRGSPGSPPPPGSPPGAPPAVPPANGAAHPPAVSTGAPR